MPVWYLVPDGVVQYIDKRGLYRDDAGTGSGVRSASGSVPAEGRPSYDRVPGSATRAGGTDDPAQPPFPHLREVPR
jgi:nicotinate-nucleotide adenylyltransferase